MEQATAPKGFRQVTKEQFFEELYKDKRDIMPESDSAYQTLWKIKNREVWGWVSTGYKSAWNEKSVYAIKI